MLSKLGGETWNVFRGQHVDGDAARGGPRTDAGVNCKADRVTDPEVGVERRKRAGVFVLGDATEEQGEDGEVLLDADETFQVCNDDAVVGLDRESFLVPSALKVVDKKGRTGDLHWASVLPPARRIAKGISNHVVLQYSRLWTSNKSRV